MATRDPLVQRYREGDRTPETRAAWAAYQRDLRHAHYARRDASLRAVPHEGMIAADIKHGIGGYTHFGCRCLTCRRSFKKATHDQRRNRLKVQTGQAAEGRTAAPEAQPADLDTAQADPRCPAAAEEMRTR